MTAFFTNGMDREQENVSISIKLASPSDILSWSYGEVKEPETINYRTFKPERDGLFCERIFGPTKDWECYCGKYKRIKNRGIICDRCGVEVTESRVRRERMGHIKLASPCAHRWYFKGTTSMIGVLLNVSRKDIESVVYYVSYIVVDPGDPEKTNLEKAQILTEEDYSNLSEDIKSDIKVGTGAESLKEMIRDIDLESLFESMREKYEKSGSKQKRKRYLRRMQVVKDLLESDNKPEWMILDVIPVLPPDLRPLVPLDGGRFAASDLNDLYRTVIIRNNRLKDLVNIKAPEVILKNEKRLLQEAVDALIDNTKRGYTVRGSRNRPLRSLTDAIKGKQGRFRQNLLGKRVDYSGRAVIVIGPELEMHQCGLPKSIALELYKPFVIQRLTQRGIVHTPKRAKRYVDEVRPEVWDILEEVIENHPVLLNRAPTLHRLGIQAFQPVLIEGNSIMLHPLVCAAFNADFDGDQMAVHLPISVESQLESNCLMLSTRNILSPATGKPIAIPTRDILLGLYALTKGRTDVLGNGMSFASLEDCISAEQQGVVDRNAKVKIKIGDEVVDTTVGRALFNDILPGDYKYINETLSEELLEDIASDCFNLYGNEVTVKMLDKMKDLGFKYSTDYGVSIGIDDLLVPEEKDELLERAEERVDEIRKLHLAQQITDTERYNRVIDIWTKTTDDLSDLMFREMREDMDGFNPIYIMSISGARASKQQVRQLAAMRGLMQKPQKKLVGGVGEIIENPIKSNFREGLNVLEYFISTHGGRKGLADTALKTADAGYLTRRLVDVAHDLIIVEEDCGTLLGLDMTDIREREEVIVPLRDRVVGRVALENIYYPGTDEIMVKANEEIDEEMAKEIEEHGIRSVKIRSVLTCESKRGVCIKCYGRNLAKGGMVNVGESVGVIAAQSIGEPGTQLTLRTFHIGGTASRIVGQSQVEVKGEGEVKFNRVRTMERGDEETVIVSRNAEISILDEEGYPRVHYTIPYGSTLLVEEGQKVEPGDVLISFDPYAEPILSDIDGKVKFMDMVEGKTLHEDVDTAGRKQRIVTEHRDKTLQPTIVVTSKNESGKDMEYPIPTGAYLVVEEGDSVDAGDPLVRIPRELGKTRDITGGLPRVGELFEARKPKDLAVVSHIDGEVEFAGKSKGKWKILIKGEVEERTYYVPFGKHLRVRDGDWIKAGDQLCDGSVNPHDILEVKGDRAVQEYLVNEIQEVYRLQGVRINDKHFECIVRKMMRKMKIEEPGDSPFLPNEEVDKFKFRDINENLIKEGKTPATAKPILQGITKAALTTDSFISAASFQETPRILKKAALSGAVDELVGLKENVIIGQLIPAGTGVVNRGKYKKQLREEMEEKRRLFKDLEEEPLSIAMDVDVE